MSEKNKPPTAKRLREAREKGELAHTPEIPHLLAAAGVFELLVATSGRWLAEAPLLLGSYIARLGDLGLAGKPALKDMLVPLGGLGLSIVLGVLLLAALLALIGNVMQTGIVVATKGVVRAERLDPIAHLKQIFSRRQLGQLFMNAVKVATVLLCTGAGILWSMDSLLRLADGSLLQAAESVLRMLVRCERLAMAALLVCVAIDWAIVKQAHNEQMMMSQEDVEREQKDQFGDKHVRRQRDAFRRDVLGGQLTENTRKANALVTNPTHFAVALLYDPARHPLPIVMARGTDTSAALMRKIAREQGIPVIRSVRLARMLYSVGRERRPVPRLSLQAVAAVYRVVAEIKAGERRPGEVVELDEVSFGDEH